MLLDDLSGITRDKKSDAPIYKPVRCIEALHNVDNICAFDLHTLFPHDHEYVMVPLWSWGSKDASILFPILIAPMNINGRACNSALSPILPLHPFRDFHLVRIALGKLIPSSANACRSAFGYSSKSKDLLHDNGLAFVEPFHTQMESQTAQKVQGKLTLSAPSSNHPEAAGFLHPATPALAHVWAADRCVVPVLFRAGLSAIRASPLGRFWLGFLASYLSASRAFLVVKIAYHHSVPIKPPAFVKDFPMVRASDDEEPHHKA